jgi:hypothetical protein
MVILHIQSPHRIIDRVLRIPIALLVICDIRNVRQVGRALTYRCTQRARVIAKSTFVQRTTELLAIPAVVSSDYGRP